MALPAGGGRLGFPLLILFTLLLGAASSSRAGTLSCGANFGGVIDGFDPTTLNTILSDNNLTLQIDSSCVIKNWPEDNGIPGFPATNINFYFPTGATYYIAFENVFYPGNMSCNSPQNSDFWIYWAPGSFNSINANCQDFMVPVDALKKFNPPAQTTASIGIPFTYTVTMPYLGQIDVDSGNFFYTNDYDTEDISNIVITDDLTKLFNNLDLTWQDNPVALTYKDGTAVAYKVDQAGNRTELGPLVTGVSQAWLDAHPLSATEPRLSDNTKHLVFSYENNPILATGMEAGYHLEIDLQVVLDNDLITNFPGNTVRNSAAFWFDKTIITYNDDGTVKSTTDMTDLYGWPFTTPPMTVAEPNLVVDKTSSETNLNVGDSASYTIDVENVGGGTAWNVEITDLLPSRQDEPGPDSGGMCPATAPVVTAQILAADLTLITDLTQGTHYSVSYDQPTCQLTLTLLDHPDAKIGPNQHLRIYYDLQLDVGTSEGLTFTNVAGATSWFNADSSIATRYQYVKPPLTDGTPGTDDFQDAYSITSATHGYFFLKSVDDLTTGDSPASVAFPGDTLRYTLQIQNYTLPTLSNVTVTEDLGALNPAGAIVSGSLTPVSDNLPGGASLVYDATGGTNGAGLITISGLTLNDGDHYQIQFEVVLDSNLSSGVNVSNQALISGDYPGGTYTTAPSDDPNRGGGPRQLMDPTEPGYVAPDVTYVTVQAPGVLSKANPAVTTATIGDQFTYQITVPATLTDVSLYDVQILDDMSRLVSGADLRFVSATAHLASGLQSWTLVNSGPDDINLILEEAVTGIDIPAGDQATVEVTVQLQNTIGNNDGDPFVNSASYTYYKINGGGSTTRLAGGAGSTPTPISVVEPALTATKTVANVTAGKAVTDPAAAGDTLRYTVTVTNNGSSEAFDTDIVDTLPGNVTYVLGSSTATIGGNPVLGFIVDPNELTPGTFAWGRQNLDNSLDIGVGETLVLTYQVTVLAVDGTPITNNVYVDWTSLNGFIAGERNGSGCPTITAPDDYCYVPTPATIATTDPTTIVKSVVSDSWDTAPSTATDSILRIGDTVVYRLALTLHEGVTQNVVVTDTLPAGLAFDSVVSINGDSTAPYSAAGVFTYADISAASLPASGQIGTLTWSLGDITNAIDNDPANDTFVIEYRALVLKDTLAQAPSTSLANNVALSYTGSDPASTNLQSGATITVRQPVMSTPTKTATGFTSPANVDIVSDVMPFHLSSCNNGLAPAYSAEFTDVLASQMDETSISPPVVIVGVTTLNAGTDYDYTYTAADRTMTFVLNTPVNPNECITIDFNIGFHSDVGPNQTWSNSVTLAEYWSLTTPTATGQQYAPLTSTPFVMTNPVTVQPLTKVVTLPASGVATIGEDVVYEITVPSSPVNAALSDVVMTDTLNTALEYVSATAVDNLGNTVNLNDNSVAPGNVNLTIAQIPAGQWVIITLTTRVANNIDANAGLSFTNTAAYIYTGMTDPTQTAGTSGSVTIVEPLIGITKNVNPATAPNAGDILTYTVNLAAQSGPDKSDAYDTEVVDTLSLGLVYEPGTATVNGSPVAPVLNGGDGITTQQTLTWSGIDIPEGISVQVIYSVRVLNGIVAGQSLANSATTRWTSLDGNSAYERDGSGAPAYNDYFATASTSLTVGDNTSLAKTEVSDTYNDGTPNVRIGDRIEFELRLGLQEGTTTGVVLTDNLPTGMAYDGLVSISPASGSSNFSYSVASQPASGDTGTLTWNLGDVVNAGDNDPSNDFLVVRYRVRVLNNDVLAQTPTTQALTNNARLDYTIGGLPATPKTASHSLYALQPLLAVSKSAAPAGGDTVIVAGETIYYTVDIINSGAAPAYDTVLTDTLPIGLRQGVPPPTTTSITLVVSDTSLTPLNPAYDPATGTATWNFDNGGADAYTIPVGETLRITYQVQADADLGPNQTLTNSAYVALYYSFDDEAPPAGATVDQREEYGPSNSDTTTLTTPLPVALVKEVKDSTQTTASIGVPFSYIITVPATVQPIALNDVRIIDDLTASVADLSFVSVTKVSTWGTWIPVNTGDAKHLVIEDIAHGGIDIPAGEQAEIEITVVLDNSATNVSGLVFNNAANYTYNTTQNPGLPGTSGDLTIAGPDTAILNKTGPATMRRGLPGTFTIDVQNTGTAPAWDLTITDVLPNPTPGGMCDNAPTNVTAQILQTDGTTRVLAQGPGADYVVGFSGAPACILTITMQSAAAAIGPAEHLIVIYDALLDSDSVGGTSLTNIAAATEWFSGDTAGGGATGSIRTYTGTLSTGTVGTDDEQDAHTLLTESPVLVFRKSVMNVTSGQNPGSSAQPDDTLQYTIHVENVSPVDLPDYALIDELDALNATALFVPGSLNIISVLPAGAVNNSNSNGGAMGTGLLDISGLSLDAQGGANASLDIVFTATLVPVINGGTVVLNQAHLSSFGVVIGDSDDPNVNGADDPNVSGDEDPTRTLITSAPSFEIWKTSQDLTGDPAVLLAGDTLRYTITVKNIGNENGVNVMLRDQIPANTTYVANSTTLNGNAVADPAAGVSPLQDGMLINAPEDTTPGAMRADATATTTNVATITFEVTVNSNVLDGTVIANQGFASGNGGGSGPFPEHPSDDPATTSTLDDPTRDVVGSLPLVDAQKTVQILTDNNSNGQVDPDDVLRYTITINNLGAIPATNVVFTDAVPANTTYEANSTFLNGEAVADPAPGVSPLIAGIPVSSSDLTPPLPTTGNGTLSPGAFAVITFDVRVNLGVSPDTIISNQGLVTTTEQPDEPTDVDGIDANGDQPTQVIVGPTQLLSITKEVLVVGGGTAEPGALLEYQIRVTNIGSTPATDVVVTDDLGSLAGQATYVPGSGLMNGSSAGVSYVGSLLTADYASQYGNLQPGEVVTVRFRVQIDPAVPIGTTITNSGTVTWNVGSQNDSASVPLDVGGTPGSAGLNGRAWHDANLDKQYDSSEQTLAGWSVELYRNNVLLATTLTDASGAYGFGGVVPNLGLPDPYELRFRAPGAGANTATLGYADSPIIHGFTNGPQNISRIFVAPSSNLQDLNLPIWPNGVVFNSVTRDPVAGATLTMLHNGVAVAGGCFDDPVQQNQVTLPSGFYKFDLNFIDPSCPPGGDYVIRVTPPVGGYNAGPSRVIPPVPGYTDPAVDPGATPYQVPLCPNDAVAVPVGFCEAQPNELAPIDTVPPTSISHYLYLTLTNTTVPGDSQIFNNHIPVDPELTGSVSITKTTSMRNVTKGQLVPYTITVSNVLGSPQYNIGIIDRFPAGFKYVQGSARLDGVPREPDPGSGRQLLWPGLTLQVNDKHTIQLLLVVGAGVTEDEYVNRAQAINLATGEYVSGEATATVRVIPDPTFDCTDVIGKVFDDRDLNGRQDAGEQGLAGVRVVTARGLIATTDEHGRFHITCAAVPDEDRGSNFILKVDDRSLPTGYRMTTENPRVQRATRGKTLRFNFGATIQHVVALDIAEGAFEPDGTELRLQWQPRISLLLQELRKEPAVLRLSYLADIESEGLVQNRLKALKKEISRQWDGEYRLTIETEVFWRRGSPQ